MKRIRHFSVTLLSLSLMVCAGCGGTSSVAALYTGLTTPAALTPANADNVAVQAYQGMDSGSSLVEHLGPATGGTQGNPSFGRPVYLSIVQDLKEATDSALSHRFASGGVAPRAIISIDNTYFDGSGGTISYSLSVNDQTGDFTGSFTYSNYHGNDGGTINGVVTVSGTYNINTRTIDHIVLTLSSVVLTDGSISVSASGTVDLLNGNPATGTINLYLRNNATGKTCWINNFVTNVTEGIGYEDVTMSGRIYIHDYGYVNVSTATAVRFMSTDTYPSSGVLIFTGSSSARVRLTFNSTTSYTVDFDGNGDGTYETSNTHTW